MSAAVLEFEQELHPEGFAGHEWPAERQGILAVALEGDHLTVTGWYDHVAAWGASVDLTEEQRRQLHEATA